MPALSLSNGAVFERAEERIREYCEIEVYRDRDYRGGYDDHSSVTDTVTAEDVEAANNLHARLSALDRGRIIHDVEVSERLAALRDEELGEIEDSRWEETRTGIMLLLSSFFSLPNIKLEKATTVLQLKRPHLVPILGPFVVRFLTGNDMELNVFSSGEALQIGMRCIDTVRSDLSRNRDGFAELQGRLADLPTPLTNVRIYDILCWTQEKWVNRGDRAGPYGVAGKSLNQRAAAPAAVSGKTEGTEAQEQSGEIRNIREFRQVKLRAEGVVVTTGSKPPRAHRALCRELSEERFAEAAVFNEGKKGRYYLRKDLAEAVRDFGAVACMKCKPERPYLR